MCSFTGSDKVGSHSATDHGDTVQLAREAGFNKVENNDVHELLELHGLLHINEDGVIELYHT